MKIDVLKCTKCHTDKKEDLLKYSFNPKTNRQYYMCQLCNRERRKKYYDNGGSALIYKLNKAQLLKKGGREKQRARMKVSYHLKMGNIVKPDACSKCGGTKPRIEGHHEDYTKPLEVIWLCTPCHRKADLLMVQ